MVGYRGSLCLAFRSKKNSHRHKFSQQVGELIVVEVAGNPVKADDPESIFPLYDREHTIGSEACVAYFSHLRIL